MSACGLAIFVKTPMLSPVKTRLWPALGREAAVHVYDACVDAVESVALQAVAADALTAYFAIAEPASPAHARWRALPSVTQCDGGLGARMAGVYASLRERHGAALLIGADAPQLRAELLMEAATWLDAHAPRLVIGSAHDGGFWLFGGNVALEADAWAQVEYSRPDTAARFVEVFADRGAWRRLDTLHDLDTAEDLAPVHAALAALSAPTPEQQRARDVLADARAAAGERA